jgi:hypothetical protein
MDPEAALYRDEFQGLIERHDDGAEAARIAPRLPPPPQDLDLIVLADRAETGNGPTGSQAVECVASVRSDHVDAAPRELIGGDARGRRRVGGSSS